MIADSHIHTHLCRPAARGPREHVARTIGRGASAMGCAAHLPSFCGWRPGCAATLGLAGGDPETL